MVVDREKDTSGDAAVSTGLDAVQPPKRPRLIRNRYPSSHAIAKKLLPIDPQAADKTRAGRKD
jgi:THO complex subunit 2